MDFYAAVGLLLRTALGFWFRRFECFRVENAPRKGPVLFTSNHPNSLADSFVIGAAVPRKVHFVATVELFRRRPVAWLLRSAGVIPINRVKDDPRAMRDVFSTFEEVFKVLERGGAVAIFPEGITHDVRLLWAGFRAATLGVRLRFAAPLLVRLRDRLIAEIEALRADYRRHKGLG